jgi:hypothetical protein
MGIDKMQKMKIPARGLHVSMAGIRKRPGRLLLPDRLPRKTQEKNGCFGGTELGKTWQKQGLKRAVAPP